MHTPKILLALLIATGTTSHAQTVVPIGGPTETNGESAVLRIDEDTLIFYQGTGGDLRVTTCSDVGVLTACQPSTSNTVVAAGTDDLGLGLDAAIGADGAPVISHIDEDGMLLLSKCADPMCEEDTTTFGIIDIGTYAAGSNSSIAVTAAGNPVVAFYDQDTTGLHAVICSNPACTLGVLVDIDDPAVEDVGRFNDVMIGSDGNPIFSYYDLHRGALKIASCADPTCSTAPTIHYLDDPVSLTSASTPLWPWAPMVFRSWRTTRWRTRV